MILTCVFLINAGLGVGVFVVLELGAATAAPPHAGLRHRRVRLVLVLTLLLNRCDVSRVKIPSIWGFSMKKYVKNPLFLTLVVMQIIVNIFFV